MFTAAVSAKIIRAKQRGATHAEAAQAGGIDRMTLKRWLHRGLRGDEPYASFGLALRRAERIFVRANVEVLAKLMTDAARDARP